MATAGQTFENPLTGERMVFRKTAHDTNGTLLEIEFFIKPHSGKGLGAHIHPSFDERFEIISGSARYMIGKDECSAAAGDVVVLPQAIQPTTYAAGLPLVFQRSLFGALAAYGRARGYKAYYPAVSNSALH